MVKQQLTNSILLGGLLLGGMAYNAAEARTTGTSQTSAGNTKSMSSEKFYETLGKTKPNQVASNFGIPDKIVSIRNAAGEVTGVMWVYHDAVIKGESKMNANFMIVNGEFIYVSLSEAS
jgi:hypothetical protein